MQNIIGIVIAICALSLFFYYQISSTILAILSDNLEIGMKLRDLDEGLLFQFVTVQLSDGSNVTGEVIGAYNERPFMWHPKNRDTLALFKCTNPNLDLHSFSTNPRNANAVWTINTDEIVSILILKSPLGVTKYSEYLRKYDVVINHQPIWEHDIYILTDWSRYHRWEDGRSNYAWDLSALNSNKMTYSNLGQNLTDFASFGLKLHVPLNGKVVSVNRTEKDHDPDLVSAVEFEALNSGSEAHLEEKPNNCLEVTPGGPFLFRMLHQKQNSIPKSIKVGDIVSNNTYVGQIGNTGTIYTPHCHVVFGFFDQFGRYWSTPIEWKSYTSKIILPYPSGYAYSNLTFHNYGYPKLGQVIKMV